MEDARPGEDALVPVEVRPVLHGQREVLAPLGHVADHRQRHFLQVLGGAVAAALGQDDSVTEEREHLVEAGAAVHPIRELLLQRIDLAARHRHCGRGPRQAEVLRLQDFEGGAGGVAEAVEETAAGLSPVEDVAERADEEEARDILTLVLWRQCGVLAAVCNSDTQGQRNRQQQIEKVSLFYSGRRSA